MKTVYLVRHGQSEANVAPVFQPPESPLSEKGNDQAVQVAARIAKLSFDVLIASPFERAHATAAAIASKTGKTPQYSDLFVERMKPTSINGKPYTDVHADTVWRAWEKSLYASDERVEDGENFTDLMTRADTALAFLLDRKEDVLVVVTHGYFLRTIVARVLLGETLAPDSFAHFQRSAHMENTGITVLRHEPRFEADSAWHLWVYNDHAHLG